MWYLPYKKFTIKTALNPDQVKQKLTEVVAPKPLIGFRDFSDKPYQGKIKSYEFKVYRIYPWIVRGRLPLFVIKGKIRAGFKGSSITAIIYPDISYIVFTIIWLFIFFVFLLFISSGIGFLYSIHNTGVSKYTILLVLTGLLILWYGLWYGLLILVTQGQLQHSKRIFQKLFKGPTIS